MSRKHSGSSTAAGIVCTLLGSLAFGALPTLNLNAYEGGITVLTMQSLKYLAVTALLMPYACIRHKVYRLGSRRMIQLLAATGFLYGAQAVLYAEAVKWVPVSVAAMLLFTYPLLVGIISAACGLERFTRKSAALLAGSFLALVPVVLAGTGRVHAAGILCAAAASLCYAIYVVVIEQLSQGLPPIVKNAFANAGPAVTITLLAAASGQMRFDFAPSSWWYILLNALGGGVLGYVLWFMGLQRLGAVRTSALSMTEPVFAALIAYVLLGQKMSTVQMLCAAVMLLLVLKFTQCQSRQTAPAERAAPQGGGK